MLCSMLMNRTGILSLSRLENWAPEMLSDLSITKQLGGGMWDTCSLWILKIMLAVFATAPPKQSESPRDP